MAETGIVELGRLALSRREWMVAVERRGQRGALHIARCRRPPGGAVRSVASRGMSTPRWSRSLARSADRKFRSDGVSRPLPGGLARADKAKMKGLTVKPRGIAAPPTVIRADGGVETQLGAGGTGVEAPRRGSENRPAPCACRSDLCAHPGQRG